MNLFIIPSWYPTRANPVAGIFFKEQAVAIGDCKPDWNVAVCLWGQREFVLSLKRPWLNVPMLSKYFSTQRESKNHLAANVVEYKLLTIEWKNIYLEMHSNGPLRAAEKNLKKALNDFGTIDVIHAHVSYPAGWIAMQLSRTTGIPYVITEHMSPFPLPPYVRRDGLLPRKIRLPLENAAAVIAVSPFLVERMNEFGIGNVTYIPNLVDERFFRPEPAHKKGRYFTFFTLGGLTAQKGVPDLLRGIQGFISGLTVEEQKEVRFHIGGDGADKGTLQLLAEDLGIADKIRWLGFVSREQALCEFHDCDCFVLTSHHETFGVVFAESIACGKPVIATRCGGPEVIVTPDNGILVDIADIEQITSALKVMFYGARHYDGEKIRGQFLERFSRSVVVSQLEKIYRQVRHEAKICAV
jgi:glycosyltransferase involved in cell wall biosynthesis